MSKYDPKIWNAKMAKFLGYTYREDDVMVEFSGIEKPVTIMSKVSILIDDVDTVVYKGVEYEHKYLGVVNGLDKGVWGSESLPWDAVNIKNFIYLHLWNPDKDWNQLMRVVNHTGFFDVVSTDINMAYEDCCKYIEGYESK